MEYNLARLELEQGKKIRREEWAADKFVELIDGHYYLGNLIWECGNSDATAKDWEVLSKSEEKKAEQAKVEAAEKREEIREKHEKATAKAAKKGNDEMTPEAEVVLAAQIADLPPTPEQINPPVDKEGKVKESKKIKTGPASERDITPLGDGPIVENDPGAPVK